MRAITEEERGILRLLFSVDFPGVDVLRAQVAAVREVEASCTCGCPSITPLVDRTTAPAARFRSLVPVELMEVARADGVPRTVLCFLDEDGYIGNLECVYYDETLLNGPTPRAALSSCPMSIDASKPSVFLPERSSGPTTAATDGPPLSSGRTVASARRH